MIGADDIVQWAAAGKAAIDLLKSTVRLLPKGKDREAIEKKVEEAEAVLQKSDAALAKGLGYSICKCEFPPQIMLWRESEKANFCGKCGHRYPPARQPAPRAEGGGGPQSWMGN